MTPRKSSSPLDADSLYEVAVKALARRAHSRGELRALLAKKKAAKKDIDAVLKRLREHGYLDDARFARAFAATHLEDRLHGKQRVRRDLLAHRVHPEVARQAVEAAYKEVDEGALLRRYLERKLRHSRLPAKPSAVASLQRRLLRAGFSSATIVRELKKLLPGPLCKAGAPPGTTSWDELLESLAEPDESEAEPRLS